jgi:hypothetical protein
MPSKILNLNKRRELANLVEKLQPAVPNECCK